MKKILTSLLLSLFALVAAQASTVELSPAARISLLTYSPASAIYAQYGHTSIRVCDTISRIDLVFNFGLFNLSKGNFAWEFSLGETDYELGIYNTSYLYVEANQLGVSVSEQELNLTPVERQRFWDALMTHYEPQNRVYRYNFWFDNCVTRPVDMLVAILDGTIAYPDTLAAGPTMRSVIGAHTAHTPWNRLGINIALGSRIDKPLTFRESFFLPSFVQKLMRRTTVSRLDTVAVPLVAVERMLIPASVSDAEGEPPLTPLVVACLVLAFCVVPLIVELRRRKTFVAIDMTLYILFGLLGVVVWFLILFSQHPGTTPNWNGLLFHPLLLFFAALTPLRSHRWYKYTYLVEGTLLLIYILYATKQQVIDFELILLAEGLLARSLCGFYIAKKNETNETTEEATH